MIFIELSELKSKLDLIGIELIRSPKTQKLFASSTNGKGLPVVLKVEQSIDVHKPTKFMYSTEDTILEGCIVNVTPTQPPLHSW